MIRTYIFNKNELEQVHFSEAVLSRERREKMERLKREEDRQLSASAELLLIYAISQLQTLDHLPLSISKDEREKLRLEELPYYFNISHAKDYAACCVSDKPVGIDIEYFRVKEIPSANSMLHPEEAAMMAYISNPDEKKKFFYECWVAKESYLKNLGIGLIVRPRDFMVSEDHLKILDRDYSERKGHHSLAVSIDKPTERTNTLHENLSYLEKRYVHVFEPGEVRGTDWKFDAGYRMAVCTMEKDPDSRAKLVHADEISEAVHIG